MLVGSIEDCTRDDGGGGLAVGPVIPPVCARAELSDWSTPTPCGQMPGLGPVSG